MKKYDVIFANMPS